MSAPPADRGAAVERTALAWTRTVLALAAGLLLLGRLSAPRLGLLAAVFVVAALPLAGWLLVRAGRRYQRSVTVMAGRAVPADARLPAGVAGLASLLALFELVTVLRA